MKSRVLSVVLFAASAAAGGAQAPPVVVSPEVGSNRTITLRYLRPTRLGQLHAEAGITRRDGVKTFTAGHLADDEGITVEAEGVFIQPRWARE